MLIAFITNTAHYHISLFGDKTFGYFNFWNSYMLQAISDVAVIADKMYMVIVVVAFGTIIFAQGIEHRIIGRGYGMYNSFFYKGLQGAVNGNPVKLFSGFLFNIGMRKCAITMAK